eukprot:CAMPEP_0170519876 /NCGR_PEP_ID=MMETSP0209-20121228/5121_1 /TAXON_ID=665100 ORGANISM="Litonotus pictus, Strain P1" /NCGR_SAMPLE_ID=MMETSP0209 /ASSEMBLY_ACC=CAM_ASM_000301 /LENGTH=977 /DNA_ID=CAMNT_0010805861 /DNA_START=685 /DNA_END=3618 /DNA_ORIENTATION=-
MVVDSTQKFIAMMMSDKTITILEIGSYSIVANFTGHSMFVNDIVFNPLKKSYVVYSGSEDGEIKVWDILLGKCLGNLSDYNLEQQDKHYLSSYPAVKLLSVSNDGNILISYSQDNSFRMYSISNFPVRNPQHGTNTLLKHFTLDSSISVNSLLYFTRLSSYYTTNNSSPSSATTPYLLLGTEKGKLLELSLKTEKIESEFKVSSQPINYLKYNKYNNCLLVTTEDQLLFNIKTKEDISVSPISESLVVNSFPGFCDEMLDIKVTSNSNFLFSSNDLGLKYYDHNNRVNKIFEGHKDFILHIEYKEGFVSTSSKDGTIRVWKEYYDINNNINRETINSSNNSNMLISSFKCLFVLKGHTEAVDSSCLLMKNNSLIVASVAKDKALKLWDLTDLYINHINMLLETKGTNSENILEPLTFSPEYSAFISNFKTSKAIIVKQSVWTEIGHDQEITFIRASHNQKFLATGGFDKICKVWKLQSTRLKGKDMGEQIHESTLELVTELKGHTRAVTDISFSKVAKLAATGSTDKTVKVWDLSTGNCISTLTGHLAAVTRTEWVYLGTHILTTGSDGLVKLWNLKTSENVVTLNCHESKIWGISLVKPALSIPKAVDCDVNMVFAINEGFFSKNNYTGSDLNVNSSVVEGECIQLNFITGGSDSTISLWTDCTAGKEIEILKEKEMRLIKEEELRHIAASKSYTEAMQLSLELNHKRDFFQNFVKYINDHRKEVVYKELERIGVKRSSEEKTNDEKIHETEIDKIDYFGSDSIGLVISNRRILEKLELETNSMNSNLCINSENNSNNNSTVDDEDIKANDDQEDKDSATKDLNFKVITDDLRTIILEYYTTILEIIRDNNVKSSTYIYSQILLKTLLKVVPADVLLTSNSKVKGSKKIKQKKEKTDKQNSKGSALDQLNREIEKLKSKEDEQKKAESKYNKIDLIENFTILKSYTEKHIERLNREITASYLLENILDSLFLIPGN